MVWWKLANDLFVRNIVLLFCLNIIICSEPVCSFKQEGDAVSVKYMLSATINCKEESCDYLNDTYFSKIEDIVVYRDGVVGKYSADRFSKFKVHLICFKCYFLLLNNIEVFRNISTFYKCKVMISDHRKTLLTVGKTERSLDYIFDNNIVYNLRKKDISALKFVDSKNNEDIEERTVYLPIVGGNGDSYENCFYKTIELDLDGIYYRLNIVGVFAVMDGSEIEFCELVLMYNQNNLSSKPVPEKVYLIGKFPHLAKLQTKKFSCLSIYDRQHLVDWADFLLNNINTQKINFTAAASGWTRPFKFYTSEFIDKMKGNCSLDLFFQRILAEYIESIERKFGSSQFSKSSKNNDLNEYTRLKNIVRESIKFRNMKMASDQQFMFTDKVLKLEKPNHNSHENSILKYKIAMLVYINISIAIFIVFIVINMIIKLVVYAINKSNRRVADF